MISKVIEVSVGEPGGLYLNPDDLGRHHVMIDPLNAVGVDVYVVTDPAPAIAWRVPRRINQLRELGADVILSRMAAFSGVAAVAAGRRLGIPSIIRLVGSPWLCEDRGTSRTALHAAAGRLLRIALSNYSLRHADAIVPLSDALEAEIRHHVPGHATPMVRVHNSVSEPEPVGDAASERGRWAGVEERIVCTLTNFMFWDKVRPLLEIAPAMEQVLRSADARWVIAGRGVHAEAFFERLAALCDERLWIQAGYVDKWPLIQASAAMLHLSFLESFGNVILEAQSAGTPVVVNAHGGMPEIVSNEETGLLVDDIQDAPAAVLTLLENETLREDIAARAQSYVRRHHSHEAIGRQLVAAFSRALSCT